MSSSEKSLGTPIIEAGEKFEAWWANSGVFPESFLSPNHPNYLLVLSYKEVAAKAWIAAKGSGK